MSQFTTTEGHTEIFLVHVPGDHDVTGAWVRVFEQPAELAEFLSRNAENDHYSGVGEPVGAIWRINFAPDGRIIQSQLSIESGNTERDYDEYADRIWLNTAYHVRDMSTRDVVTVYHVSIDGDA